MRISESEDERNAFWAGRKAAFPAVGRLSPDYFCMDGTIPRSELPRVLTEITEMSKRYGLGVANALAYIHHARPCKRARWLYRTAVDVAAADDDDEGNANGGA